MNTAKDTVGAERSNITGIVLHVAENDVQPSEVLDFYKVHSRTIDVGRKSSQGGTEHVPGRALFRCPVVSRKHAKITFAEYGNVYITDLHSHHGTHILRPGDFVSTALKPEIPVVLADGDLITFGKSVGRDDYLVRPIVVRVELIFGGDAPPLAPLPLSKSLDADAAEDGSPSPPSDDDHENCRSSSRPSTGRYGVFLPSPESSSSSSDGDSDIQEISPPTSPQAPGPCFAGRGGNVFAFGGRTRLLQQFLPPIRFTRSNDQFSFEGQGGVAEEEDMDLSSSRASPAPPIVFEEPAIIGAWPGSPPELGSDFDFVTLPPILKKAMNVQREVIEISDDDSGPPRQDAPVSMPVSESEDSHENRDEPLIETMDVLFGQVESINAALPAPLHHVEDDHIEITELGDGEITFDLGPIEAQVADTCTELNVLRSAQDKNETQFTAHVRQTKERLDALDNHTRATEASLAQRSDELSAMQTRLEGLENIVSGLQEHSALAERVEELVKEVGAAKDMLRVTCELQRQTRMQMEAELQAVKALRAEAAATVAEAKLVSAAANEEALTLKRKRDDDIEMGTEDEPRIAEERPHDVVPSPPPSKRRRTMRVVSAIARTATVATVGAVAAWSALAYS